MKIKVKADIEGIKQRFSEANFDKARYALANQMLADMNKFVPKNENTLRMTGHVSADGKEIIWDTKYAKAQFYGSNGKVSFSHYTEPGTGKRWDLKAQGIHQASWNKVLLKGMGL